MKKTTILLSISILLNIFFIGYLAGNKFSSKRHHHKDFKSKHLDKKLMTELKNKRKELFEIVSAPEFNETLFDEKIKEIQIVHDQIQSKMPEKLKQKIIGKNQEERVKIIQKIKRKHRHRM